MNIKNETKTILKYKLALICLLIIVVCISLIFGSQYYFSLPANRKIDFLDIPVRSILSSFMASSLMVLIFELYLKRETKRDFDFQIRSAIEESVSKTLKLKTIGVRAIHDDFSFPYPAFKKIAQDSNELFILQTYAPNILELRQMLYEVWSNGGIVRVIFVAPKSKFVELRFEDVPTKTKTDFISGINSNINRLEEFFSNRGHKKGKLEIRLYDGNPGIAIYATDKGMLTGNFLCGTDAINSPQLEITANSNIYKKYIDHFHKVWDKSIKTI